MNETVVSVVIPAYNAEQSLRRCVESALTQAGPVVEVIVIDDGSTDDTAEVGESFGDQIKFAVQENAGQGAARNHGLTLATGQLLAFLDADDYWKPDFLKNCCEFLKKHPSAVAVNTGFTVVSQDGTSKDYPELPNDTNNEAPRLLDDFYRFWATHDHVRTGTVLMKTDAARTVGGQLEDLRISQDLEFWGMLATLGPWGFIPTSYWIGDSRVVGKKTGWKKKYEKRRKLCPTVEQWERRLLGSVPEESRSHFEKVRGRVAAGYMHAKIIGGDFDGAKHILNKYGATLPPTKVKQLLSIGSRFGSLGWKIAVAIIRFREGLK